LLPARGNVLQWRGLLWTGGRMLQVNRCEPIQLLLRRGSDVQTLWWSDLRAEIEGTAAQS
jgi:hypothetical protein